MCLPMMYYDSKSIKSTVDINIVIICACYICALCIAKLHHAWKFYVRLFSTSHSLAPLPAPVQLNAFPSEESFFLLLIPLPEAPLNFTAHATLFITGLDWVTRVPSESWNASAIKDYNRFRRTLHYTGDV